MTPIEKRIYGLVVILMVMAGGVFVYSQTPPGPNTIQHGEGANYPTVTATDGYFYGATNITDRLFGDFTGLPLTGTTLDTGQGVYELYAMNQDLETTDAVTFATVDTGQGANELYSMNQDVETTDAVTFATVDTGQGANELYDMNQNVLTTSDVDFNSVNATEFYLNSVNKTDIFAYPQTEASYVIWRDGSTYYAKNGNTGLIQFSGTNVTTVIQAAVDVGGGDIKIMAGTFYISTPIYVKRYVHIWGSGPWATLFSMTADTQVFILNETQCGIHNLGIYANTPNIIANTTILIESKCSWQQVTNIKVWRDSIKVAGGIVVGVHTPAGWGEGIGYSTYGDIDIVGRFHKALWVYSGDAAEWINMNDFYRWFVSLKEHGIGVHIERSGAGELTGNHYDSVKVQACTTAYLVVNAKNQHFTDISTWDMPTVSIAINVTGGQGNWFERGFISRPVVNTGTGTTINVVNYEGYLVESEYVPFVEGTAPFVMTVNKPQGWNITASGHNIWASWSAPMDMVEIIYMDFFAISGVDEADAMELEVSAYFGKVGEQWNSVGFVKGGFDSTSTSISTGEIILWHLEDASHTEFNNIDPGDSVQILVRRYPAQGDNCETNAVFHGIMIYYRTK